ncbi:hypothetical protein NX059_007638 [Plenodomus lindquistii]|nr:hypothetical protein NX059_007638 [Plenodomus lindquistii]
MSDYVDQDMQFAPFGDHVDLTDWSQLQEEVAKEPWLDWPGDDIAGDPAQATAQQPDDR